MGLTSRSGPVRPRRRVTPLISSQTLTVVTVTLTMLAAACKQQQSGCYATAELWRFEGKYASFILFTYNGAFILKGCVTFTLNAQVHGLHA